VSSGLHIWYLQTFDSVHFAIVLSVRFRFTDSNYPFGVLKLFLLCDEVQNKLQKLLDNLLDFFKIIFSYLKRVSLVEQQLLTLPKKINSDSVLVRIALLVL
jgi:TRAP-type C4-dicarboxylate transport system permease large subunit